MELSEQVLKYEASLGNAMMKYGSTNETGKMLAKELLAREMQARELLAREMGSHAESRDRKKKKKSKSRRGSNQHSNNMDSTCGNSVAMSVEGSLMSRSRWEPDAFGRLQHESSSLPADFLYFKFEQMVARWTNLRVSSVMSLERYRPHLRNAFNSYLTSSRPPKTITTIANPKSEPESGEASPAKKDVVPEEDKNLPRFMRSTNVSATRSKGEAQLRGRSKSPQKKKTKQKGLTVETRPNSTSRPTRSRASSSPVKSQACERSAPPTKRSPSPYQMTESQKRKRLPVKPPTPKFVSNSQSSNNSAHRSEARGPQNTEERSDAPHYQRREESPNKKNSALPDPDTYRPDPDGQRWQRNSTRVRSPSPQPNTGRSATPNSRVARKTRGTSPSPRSGAPTPHGEESPKQESTRRRKSRLPPIPTFRNPSPNPQRQQQTNSDQQNEAQKDPAPQIRGVEETAQRDPTPQRNISEDQPQENEQVQEVSERETSPSKRVSEKALEVSSPNRESFDDRNDEVAISSSPPKSAKNQMGPDKQRESQELDSNYHSKKTAYPNVSPHSSPRTGTSQAKKTKKKQPLPHHRPSGGHQEFKHTIASPQRRQTPASPGRERKSPKSSPRTRGSPEPRRYRRMHIYSAIVIQSYRRMLPFRREYVQIYRAATFVQSLFRRRVQMRKYKKLIKGRRLRNFSAKVIQRNFRMAICRSSYFQLKHETVVLQSAVRMFLCRSTYTDLRSASTKLLGRNLRSPKKATPRGGQVTVRGGRLRIYSALLIQSLVRMRWVRSAYIEIITSTKIIQRWFRGVHKIIMKKNRAATVIQSCIRMASYRECYLDLRANVVMVQAYIRMMCIRSKFKSLKAERSATRIQSHCRRKSCQTDYSQLRTSTIILQVWIRGRSTRIKYLRLRSAAVSLQNQARKKIAIQFVRKTRAAVAIQKYFRSFLRTSEYQATRALLCIMQANIRCYLQRKRYASVRSAAVSMQKLASARRTIKWVEDTKMKRAKMNVSPSRPHYDNVLSAALAFVSNSPRASTPRKIRPTPGDTSVFDPNASRRDSTQSLPTQKNFSGLPPRQMKDDIYGKPNLANLSESKVVWEQPVRTSANISTSDEYPLYRSTSDPSLYSPSRLAREQPLEASGLPRHYGDYSNGPRPLYPMANAHHGGTYNYCSSAQSSPGAPLTPPQNIFPNNHGITPNTLHVPALQFPNQYSNPSSPYDTNGRRPIQQHPSPYTPSEYLQSPSGRFIHQSPGQAPFPSMQLQGVSQGIPNTFVPAPPDLVAKMSPSRQSPVQPMYFISQSPDRGHSSTDPPQIYALRPLNNQTSPHYLTPPSLGQPREAKDFKEVMEYQDTTTSEFAQRPIEKEKLGLKGAILDGLKRERTKRRTHNERKSFSRKFPPASPPSNPASHFDKRQPEKKTPRPETEEGGRTTKENFDRLGEMDTSFSKTSLKQVYHNSHAGEIVIPPLKKEDDSTDKAISEKLAAIKRRSRLRTIQRWSKRTMQERSKSPKKRDEVEEKREYKGDKEKRELLDGDVGQWAKQTIQHRKMSIFTSSLDSEGAIQIQSIWRSHRAKVLVASAMLQTWHVACDFIPDLVGNDRTIRHQAHMLAISGACGRVGVDLRSCKVYKRGSLILAQWEGLIPITFSKEGIDAEDTCCTVSVQASVKRTILADSWSEDKSGILLIKAALEKDHEDQRQKFRRSSMFEKSLTKRRSDRPSSRIGHPAPPQQSRLKWLDEEETSSEEFDIDEEVTSDEFYTSKEDDSEAGTSTSSKEDDSEAETTSKEDDSEPETKRETKHKASKSFGVPDHFQQRMRVHSAILIQSWYRMCVCRSMYQGLRRIQSRISVRLDKDGSPIKFHRFFLEKHTCETIIEEGFECVDPPPGENLDKDVPDV